MTSKEPYDSSSFAPATQAQWLALAQKALQGADFTETLVSRTDDGIRIDPVFERRGQPIALPRQRADQCWTVVQRIDDPDPQRARLQALEDIAQGATGLSLIFEGAPNGFGYGLPTSEGVLDAVLEGIPLDRVHLRLDVHPASRAVADWLVALLTKRRADPARLALSFGIDPAAIFAGTGRLRMSVEALQASMPQSLAHFFALGVPGVLLEADGRVLHNAGATEAQELGFMLASAVSHLRLFQEARQALIYAAPHIGFALCVDQDQFLSMAKIRAMRRLWDKVQRDCGVEPSIAAVHAETSYRMIAFRDPETNILRNTIAAFAAATGGADSVSVLPHTIAHGLPEGFARRIARNTQLLLAAESHLDFVADPAAGSGGIEALTDALCQAAWAEFQQIESEGGVMKSLSAGAIQQRVTAARDRRAAQFAAKERSIVGTTVYPLATERPVATLPAEKHPPLRDGATFCVPLPPFRLDETSGDNA